ncbi:hypothetical protein H6F88_16390 [Oculatella sp. FACHB-28]|uniref:hypothetical protein n=1 Tax=Cyanophyceae TaxID=3028117 RepID=UPI00168A334B|nr:MULTISPECIES: hypothetical protein [Cyanophyceae]MBD1870660.1 hypothetical protein [Cyanobacteria bacterium FACHB-471]MBD1999060.1 hypothetical protein [Leptolyngbya sp. FACHB-541]MBD2057578.1 hypothetical protein [Oculatella sp. FACHB-28]MBD2070135.1 hypothetical protein [Leptolyngbya sp. FACHB-671]
MTQDKNREGIDLGGAPSPQEQAPAAYQDEQEREEYRKIGAEQVKAEQKKNEVEGSPNQGTDSR